MKVLKKRWKRVMSAALLLAVVAVSLPDALSFAATAPDDPTGEVSKDLKLPNDPSNRGPGLVNPGDGGRAGGSRDASNPDDFSVNSPGIRTPDVNVEVVPGSGFSRLIIRMQQMLFRIFHPGR